jgi:hypothetical protein
VNIVITQSMLFPWVGMLEQMRLADVFVHYDDVQFSKGSFTNRVQVKQAEGSRWMTVPLKDMKLGQTISEVNVQDARLWRDRHLAMLDQSFEGAAYAKDAIRLVERVYAEPHKSIGSLARSSMLALADYYGLLNGKRVIDVQDLGISGASSQRVLDVVAACGGDCYITGRGALNYLDHDAFERAGVKVRYMRYECHPYPQSWGAFTPYVTGLDLVANCGPAGATYICSDTSSWRDVV